MTTERRTQDRRVSPAVGEFAIGECARLRALNKELARALRDCASLIDENYDLLEYAMQPQIVRDAEAVLAKVAP